ncbi:MAG: TetM/TetW/TetO/TetS family tetracycline resistance ribosomal protection protein [Clostridia bacterium]|nr:TetM/TetW/TetO/TetS family tetracycline resistance ribosomal protection protein [Clostridia bacterium]
MFKITREKGERLTHLKVTGGALKVKDPVKYGDGEEKINQIRLYNGPKFVSVNEALPGDVCAVTGLSKTFAGEKLGSSAGVKSGHLEPVMRYRMIIPESVPARTFYPIVKALEEENPELRVRWDERASAIFVSLMGTVQAEILKRLIKDRSDVDVGFDTGTVIYKETIAGRVEGVGHYEPLKHYAEVHLVLEELPRGSGLVLASSCRENDLELRWQRLILTHLAEKEHLGVLTGSAITDMKITLTAGKAHLKHTEGGDFRQATYRAVRQGLMKAESVLLEPYYSFVMELPASDVGRAITDVRMMGGEFEPPSEEGGVSVLRGRAPVKEMDGYMTTLASYTGGEGKLSLSFAGYDRCHDADKVIKTIDYDPERDVANSPDSVFCAHGAGFVVKCNEVGDYMHLEATLAADKGAAAKRRNISIDEKELEAIMLREFGPIKRPVYSEPRRVEAPAKRHKVGGIDTSLIIIDGYNVIYSWDDLRAIADAGDLEGARERLISIAVNYAAFTGCRTAVVFDAYRVPGGNGEKYEKNGVNIVYTKENETGDAYIERIVYGIGKNEKVRVVTSDWLIQLTALRTGVLRMSSAEFEAEVEAVDARIGELIKKHFDVYDSDGGA